MMVFIYSYKINSILKIADTKNLDILIFSQIIMIRAMEKEYAFQRRDVHLPFVGTALSAFLEIIITLVMVCVVIQFLTTQVSLNSNSVIVNLFQSYMHRVHSMNCYYFKQRVLNIWQEHHLNSQMVTTISAAFQIGKDK